jgi:hypothetical protein
MSATLSGGLAEALLAAMEPEQAQQPEKATPLQPSSEAHTTQPAGLRQEGGDSHADIPSGSSSGDGAGCSAAAKDRRHEHLRRPVLLSCEGRSYPVRTKYLGAPGALLGSCSALAQPCPPFCAAGLACW